ncbi:MAG: nucleoside triphosphate pyrophosphohydrolase [Desulfobulbaceae bacterium]|nr:nucleoside triphosphate pyrophosphohydrolase [Desulfobulbaceae bacterium]
MRYYNKLVRDNIPNIIQLNNEKCSFRLLSDDEMKKCLIDKLIEEVKEFIDSESVEELADILEVIESIISVNNYSWEEILVAKMKKKD